MRLISNLAVVAFGMSVMTPASFAQPWSWQKLATQALEGYPSIQASASEQQAAEADLDAEQEQQRDGHVAASSAVFRIDDVVRVEQLEQILQRRDAVVLVEGQGHARGEVRHLTVDGVDSLVDRMRRPLLMLDLGVVVLRVATCLHREPGEGVLGKTN